MKYRKTIRASKSNRASRSVAASRQMARRRAVRAEDEIEDDIIDAPVEDAPVDEIAEVSVDDAASTLLFEAEDVAELISEVTDLPVDVTVDDEGEGSVTFAVGEDEYTITPEGDEEILEASKINRGRRVSAARRASARRVSASRKVSPRARRSARR